jgi:hypothetical protein
MAYAPEFEYDVFVSYAHVDNLNEETGVTQGWVDRFHHALEVGLIKRVGRMGILKTWRDDALGGTQIFDDAIRSRIEGAAVFLVLCSPAYLKSDYCRTEREHFWRWAAERGGARVGERSRVANVLLYNIAHTSWPAELSGTSGFAFYDAPRAGTIGTPLDPGSPAFRSAMNVLVEDVYTLLEAMQPAPVADRSADVFLAETSDGLRSARTRLAADLARSGLRVLSGIPPPHAAAAHDQAIQDALDRTRLSVHLVDALGGAPVAGSEDETYPRRQLALAEGAKPRSLVWLPCELATTGIEDPAQRAFVERLESAQRPEGSYELLRIPLSELALEIERALARLDVAPEPAPGAAPAVLLDTHLKDQALAFDAGQRLLARNVQPFLNPEDDDPRRNSAILHQRLKQVQGLIIFFGSVSEQWVRARLAEAINIVVADGCPVRFFGVYLGPQSKADARFELPFIKLHILDNRRGFDPGTLEPVIGALGAARA